MTSRDAQYSHGANDTAAVSAASLVLDREAEG